MTRISSHLVTSLILVAGLVLASGISGFLRPTHAFAQVGVQTFVICGSNGAEEITVDRHGNPIAPEGADCAHCAECTLVAAVLMTAPDAPQARPLVPSVSSPNSGVVGLSFRGLAHPSRGPPLMNRS